MLSSRKKNKLVFSGSIGENGIKIWTKIDLKRPFKLYLEWRIEYTPTNSIQAHNFLVDGYFNLFLRLFKVCSSYPLPQSCEIFFKK